MKVKLFASIEEAESLIPSGQLKLLAVENEKICISRIEKKFYAFDNLCPHMGAQLHQGNLNPFNEVVCPLHTYRFHLDTGEESTNRCPPLKKFEIVEENGCLSLILV
jgi:nitrite reductase/ring-hydroxylating ferredoxin subunit